MKSRITIEVNFDNGNLPIIQVIRQQSEERDDVRDNLVQQFLQSLQHTSRWCKIDYIGDAGGTKEEPKERWFISAITPKEISDEVALMLAVKKEIEDNEPKKPGSPMKNQDDWDEVASFLINKKDIALDSETIMHLNNNFHIITIPREK
jgi:hypothetical protein